MDRTDQGLALGGGRYGGCGVEELRNGHAAVDGGCGDAECLRYAVE